MARDTAEDALFAEAFDLAIGLQEEATPERLARAREWRARGPAHAAVWARVSEIHGMTGQILADRRRSERRLGRRRFLVAGALGLGGLAAWQVARHGPLAFLGADVATGTAEVRRLVLPDGSKAVLGPETALAFDFTPARREVALLAGAGYFDVAADGADLRPFVVRAGGARAETRDAGFEVGEAAGDVTVTVARGVVTLAGTPLAEGEAARRLGVGDVEHLGDRPAAQVADWRGGVTLAEDERVAALVARIARWRDGPVIVGPGLGERRVSGVFDLANPDAALTAVVRPLGGSLRRIGPLALLLNG